MKIPICQGKRERYVKSISSVLGLEIEILLTKISEVLQSWSYLTHNRW